MIVKSDFSLILRDSFRAIVFAAALVLGFSMFAKNKPDSEVEAAFDGAKEILELFSLQSAQAAHYFEILTLLSNAINEQRQRLASQPRRSKSAYIGRIFSLDGPETGHQYAERGTAASANTGLNENPFPSALVDLDSNEGTDISDFWSTSTFPLPIPSQSADEEAFMGWDSLHLPVWDNFPFVENPFISKTD